VIGKPQLQHTTPIIWGAWMKDAKNTTTSDDLAHIWTAEHYTGKKINEYASMEDLENDKTLTVHELTEPYFGTGHVVYNGALFYHRPGYAEIIKYDLTRQKILGRINVPRAGFHGSNYLYSAENSYFDIAADENGLWVIYAKVTGQNSILVSKLDPTYLSIERTWDIRVKRSRYGNGFIVCGVLYLVRDVRSKNTVVDFAYDLFAEEKLSVSLQFTNSFEMNNQLSYNPTDQKIYGWDGGNLLLYPLLI